MAAPPPTTMKRTPLWDKSGRISLKLGSLTSLAIPRPPAGFAQPADILHETLEFQKSFFYGQFQIFAQQRPVDVLLVDLDDRIDVIGFFSGPWITHGTPPTLNEPHAERVVSKQKPTKWRLSG